MVDATEHFDVVVVGAGLVGAALAAALRGSHYRVALLESGPPTPWRGGAWDTRVYALSAASVDFLSRCGVWEHLDAARIAPISRMQVYGDAGGALALSAWEQGVEALAWIVESGPLLDELWQTVKRQPNIRVLSNTRVVNLQQHDEVTHVSLADGRQLSTKLVVGADGANSWVRNAAQITADVLPYDAQGVVANFACSEPHGGVAFQWFRPDGVLAWLPLPGQHFSMVWSAPEAHAAHLMGLSAEVLADIVAQAGDMSLGPLQLLNRPESFPLRRLRVKNAVQSRLALIGDAAHVVHPLAGQGVNLGFADARVLADKLLALPAWRDCGELAVLRAYARERAEEVERVLQVTHGLQRLFAAPGASVTWLRNTGMRATAALPLVRAALMRQAAGLL